MIVIYVPNATDIGNCIEISLIGSYIYVFYAPSYRILHVVVSYYDDDVFIEHVSESDDKNIDDDNSTITVSPLITVSNTLKLIV
jgi:hypothetical protein